MSGSVTISISGAPGTVEVDQAHLAAVGVGGVDELGRVLLEMGPGDGDGERPVRGVERQPAERGQRQVVLADLVALGQVRVEVVLAVPASGGRRGRLDRGAGRQDVLDRAPVDDRQRTRQPEADRADARVRWGAVVVGRAAAEHLRRRPQLAVDLDPDDRFVPFEGLVRRHEGWPTRARRSMRASVA